MKEESIFMAGDPGPAAGAFLIALNSLSSANTFACCGELEKIFDILRQRMLKIVIQDFLNLRKGRR